jgi:arylsulfatase A-like enzyme
MKLVHPSAFAFVLLLALAFRGVAAKPNIIVFMTDDQKTKAVGYNNPQILTPNIDALARRGLIFDRCYATTSICMPARCSMMTGMYEFKTGVNFESGKLAQETWHSTAYPALLKDAGYIVGFGGKFGFGVSKDVHRADFDEWAGWGGQGSYQTGHSKNGGMKDSGYAKEHPHVTRALGAFGRDFVRKHAGDRQPFCLNIWFKAPHSPHDYIDPIDEAKYAGVTFGPPGNWGHEGKPGSGHIPVQAKVSRQWIKGDAYYPKKFQDTVTKYNKLIAGVDDAVQMILDEVERQDADGDTVIIFTSDNGYFGGAHGMGDKVLLYEEGAKIPLVIVDPRVPSAKRGRRANSLAGNIDLAPTILQLAGVTPPAAMDGVSLVPVLQDSNASAREDLLLIQNWGWAEDDFSRSLAVLHGRYKYLYWCYGDRNIAPAEELYDLSRDPLELTNLIDQSDVSSVRSELQKRYDAHLESWKRNAVPDETWTRMGRVFDRNIPWKSKALRTGRSAGKFEVLESSYQELTGAKVPE